MASSTAEASAVKKLAAHARGLKANLRRAQRDGKAASAAVAALQKRFAKKGGGR